jgi:hypothetical protein
MAMRRLSLLLVAACLLFAAIAHAQSKAAQALKSGTTSNSWNCAAPSPAQAVPVGDVPDHMYIVQQIKCTATKGEIAGIKEQEGTATEFLEVKGANVTGHGFFVETLANGDKLHVTYEAKGVSKNKGLQSGSNKWTVVGGTGKFEGAKGSGTCVAKGNADGSVTFDCKGTYTLAK